MGIVYTWMMPCPVAIHIIVVEIFSLYIYPRKAIVKGFAP
jgi:hypothetical protein